MAMMGALDGQTEACFHWEIHRSMLLMREPAGKTGRPNSGGLAALVFHRPQMASLTPCRGAPTTTGSSSILRNRGKSRCSR
jgi:hypothetical protein